MERLKKRENTKTTYMLGLIISVVMMCGMLMLPGSVGIVRAANGDIDNTYTESWSYGLTANANSTYSGGSGTASDPYQIGKASDLAQLSWNTYSMQNYSNGKYFILTADIDLSGKNWLPIGANSSYNDGFQGIFDGNLHKIKNMTIDTSKDDRLRYFIGCFGWAYNNAQIKNLGLEGATVLIKTSLENTKDAGILLGYADSNIKVENCYVSGKITSDEGVFVRSVGGLIGQNYNGGSTKNCSFIGEINIAGTNTRTGGLIGYWRDTVPENCYVAATIEATGTKYAVSERATNCYYDNTLNSTVTGGQGIGKSTVEMKTEDLATLLNNGEDVWSYDAGINNGYPYLKGVIPTLNWTDGYTADANYAFSGGNGTSEDPYLISTQKDLAILALNTYCKTSGVVTNNYNGKYFKQTQNIDLAGKYWLPIGTGQYNEDTTTFKGNYDGDGFIISNMVIDTAKDSRVKRFVGFFGRTTGLITNLGLDNAKIIVDSTANNSASTVEHVGLLVSYESINSTVKNCFAVGDIDIEGKVGACGGLIGARADTSANYAENSFFRGTITAGTNGAFGYSGPKGFIGENRSYTTSNCYVAATFINCTSNLAIASSISNCYYDSVLNTTASPGTGAIGKTTAEMKTSDMAASLNTNGRVWVQYDSINDGYPIQKVFVEPPTLSGNSVYRSSAESASVRFLSDKSGTAYYKVTDSATAPETDDLSGWNDGGSVTADTTASISNPEGLSSGAKYIHIVVKDSASRISNVLTVSMPYDIYFNEDFEAYPEGTYLKKGSASDSDIQLYIVGGGHGTGQTNQKVVSDNDNTKRLKTVANMTGLDSQMPFGSTISSDYITMEADVCIEDANGPLNTQIFMNSSGMGKKGANDDNGVNVSIETNRNIKSKTNYSGIDAEIGKTYHIMTVLDVTNGTYDYYIDGEKKNSESISSEKNISYFGIYNGGGARYFDNIKWYVGTIEVPVPAEPQYLHYNGQEQKFSDAITNYAEIEPYVTATGDTAKTNAGSYQTTLSLKPGCVWADGTTDDETVDWEIDALNITINSVAVADKVYDGYKYATVSDITFNGLIGSETLTRGTDYTVSADFSDANVGDDKVVTVKATLTTTGAVAKNYNLSGDGKTTATASITPKPITITGAKVDNKVFDNTTKAYVSSVTFDSTIPSGEYTVSAVFEDANAGENKDVTVTVTLNSGNYSLTENTYTAKATISKKVFWIGSASVSDKIYDGTTKATKKSLSFSYTNTQPIENTDYKVTASFDDKNVGDNKSATITVTLLNNNFEFSGGSSESTVHVSAKINKKPLSISGIDVESKVYDGKTDAEVTTVTFDGLVADEKLSINNDYRVTGADFENADVGNDKSVTVNVELKDTQTANNYTLSNGTYNGAKANISYASLSLPKAVTGLTYTGAEHTGVTGYENDGFTLKSGDIKGTNAGNYTAVFALKDNYIWSDASSTDFEVEWSIAHAAITDAKLSYETAAYDGKAKEPEVTVKAGEKELTKDTDYTVTYADNVNKGTAKVTVKGIGNYTGTKELTFAITEAVQKAPAVSKTDETVEGTSDGTITGVTAEMEYRKEGESTYTPITGEEIKGLAPGTYYVRVKANANFAASEDTKITIAAGKEEDITSEITYAENVPVEEKEVVIQKTNTDNKDIDGSVSKYLMPKAVAKKQTIKLTWNKIKGADGYIIYGALCGKKLERVTEIKSGSKKTWTAKKLKKGKYYKYVVVAYKNTAGGKQKVITTSKTVHAVTDGGKKGNPTGLKLKKSKITVKVGKKQTIKATLKYKKKVATHVAKFRYESNDTSIATVDYRKGVVKGVKKGKTFIYVFTQNGICKKVTVTVK